MIPHVKLAAVPISSNQELGCNRDAADMIRRRELKFELECALASPLDNAATFGAILGNRNPQRLCVRGDAAGVEPLTILNLDSSQGLASLHREFVQKSFPIRCVDRSHPQAFRVRVYTLDVIGRPFQADDSHKFESIERRRRGRNCRYGRCQQ